MIPVLNLCSGHMWHASGPKIQPVGLAWKCQQNSILVPPLPGCDPTCARGFLNRVQNILVGPLLHLCISGLLPGDLCNWYTSLYTSLISSLVDLGQMSSMADGSTLRSCLGEGCHQPGQMTWLYSFCLVAEAWVNIQYIRNGQWSPQGSHIRYSSQKTLALSHLSASHTEIPSSFARFLVAAVFVVRLSYLRLNSVW